jgi:predicted ester cyclase
MIVADPRAKGKEDRMAETELAATVIDEATVRALFGRFNDREAFFADPEGTWIDRPHYRVFAQNLEMHTREEVVAWFHGFFDAVPDLHMEVEDVVVAGEPGHERLTVRWHITGTFSGAPYMGIEPTGRRVDLRGMDLVSVDNGRVAGNNIYYDQLTFARQVGPSVQRRHQGAGGGPRARLTRLARIGRGDARGSPLVRG